MPGGDMDTLQRSIGLRYTGPCGGRGVVLGPAWPKGRGGGGVDRKRVAERDRFMPCAGWRCAGAPAGTPLGAGEMRRGGGGDTPQRTERFWSVL